MNKLQVIPQTEDCTNGSMRQLQLIVDDDAISVTHRNQAKDLLAQLQNYKDIQAQLQSYKGIDGDGTKVARVENSSSSIVADENTPRKGSADPAKEMDGSQGTVITKASSSDSTPSVKRVVKKPNSSRNIRASVTEESSIMSSGISSVRIGSVYEPALVFIEKKQTSKQKGGNTSRLERRLSDLQEKPGESKPSMEDRMEETKNFMDTEHEENSKQREELMKHMGMILIESADKVALLSHWEFKSTRLLMKCLSSNGDKHDKAVREMEDWKRIQDERIASMQLKKLILPVELLCPNGRSRFSKRASLDPSLSASVERVVAASKNVSEQIREEAKVELLAIEECLALDRDGAALDTDGAALDTVGAALESDGAALDTDGAVLKRELVVINAILESTSDDDEESLVYQLSCKNSNGLINYVGTATSDRDLQAVVEKHFNQVVKAIKKSQGQIKFVSVFENLRSKSKSTAQDANHAQEPPPPKRKSKSNGPDPREAWSSDFAQQFAKHFKPKSVMKSVSETDVILFCQKNMKVEVLRRKIGKELYWKDESKKLFRSIPSCKIASPPSAKKIAIQASIDPKFDNPTSIISKIKTFGRGPIKAEHINRQYFSGGAPLAALVVPMGK